MIGIFTFATNYLGSDKKYRVARNFINDYYTTLYLNGFITEDKKIVCGKRLYKEYNRLNTRVLTKFLRKHFNGDNYRSIYGKVYSNRTYYQELGLISLHINDRQKEVFIVEKPRALIDEINRDNYYCVSDFSKNNNLDITYKSITRLIRLNQQELIEAKVITVDKQKVINIINEKALKTFIDKRNKLIKYNDPLTDKSYYYTPASTFLMAELGLSKSKANFIRNELRDTLLEEGVLLYNKKRNGLLLVRKPKAFKQRVLDFLDTEKGEVSTPRKIIFNEPCIENPNSFYAQFTKSERMRSKFNGFKVDINENGRKRFIITDRVMFIKSLNKYVEDKAQ